VRLEVRHLEVLLAIEGCGSISGAARKLGVDQPHITRQLRRIEQRLDIAVFIRTARGVVPTEAGQRVLTLARRALGIIDDLAVPDDVDPSGRSSATLRILYHGLPAIAILDDLSAQQADLQVRFGTATPRDAFEQLWSGAADVFLGIWLPHVEWPSPGPLVMAEILADPTYVYLAADHRLADRPELLRLPELASENWITGVSEDGSAMVAHECRLVGGFEPRVSHRIGDQATVSTLLSRGQGVMLGSSVAAPYPSVVGRPYQGSSSARWMQVYAPGRLDSTLVATVATLLRRRHEEWSATLQR
jgi:DNA-binding transcriptional LysR family regulator